MRRVAPLATAALATIALAACSNVLGLKDLEPYPSDGGAEASTDGPATGEAGGDDGPAMGDDATADGDAGADEGGSGDAATGDGPGGDGTTGHDGSTSDGGSVDAPDDSPSSADAPAESGCGMTPCPPTVLANVDAVDIVVVGSKVYWVDGNSTAVTGKAGSVWSCDVANCQATSIQSGQVDPLRIATDGTSVFWVVHGSGAADGAVYEYPGTGSPTPIATSQPSPEGIAADSSYVYWVEDASTGSKLVQYKRTTPTGLTQIALSSGSSPSDVAIASGEVYFTEPGAGDILQCSEGNCGSPTVFVSGLNAPAGIWVDSTWVYWTEYQNGGAVWRAKIASPATREQIGLSQPFPVRIAGDTSDVYWTAFGAMNSGGALASCTQPGCTNAAAVEPSLNFPIGLALDSTAVYYGTSSQSGGLPTTGALWRMAR